MDCIEYYGIREQLQDGDIALYRGTGFLAKSIQYFDEAFYNHAGIVKWVGDRLFTVEMWNRGIQFIPLSRRMDSYKDFCIVRPKNKTMKQFVDSIDIVVQKMDKDVQYDYLLLPRIALYKKTKIDLVGIGKRNGRLICSELAQSFTDSLNIECYKNIDLITPQDFIRYANNDEVDILFNYLK